MKHGTAWVYDNLPTVDTRTFEQINRDQLARERRERNRLRWRGGLVAQIRQHPEGARTFVSKAMGGLVIEALGYEAYRALGGDGRAEKNNDF